MAKKPLRAKDITGWDDYYHTKEDVDTLQMLVRRLPPDAIVINIGAGLGTSALAMLEARNDLFILSIDTRVCAWEQKHLKKARLYDLHRVVRLLGRSQEIGEHWPWRANIMFIDGAHDFRSIREDAEIWVPKVKPGGIIAFHDYGPGEKYHLVAIKHIADEVMKGHRVILHRGTIKAFWQKE